MPDTNVFTPPSTPHVNPAPAAAKVVGNPDPNVLSQSHEPITPAQQRFADQQAAAVAADPWKDPNLVLTRGPDGTITARPRTDGGANGTPGGDGQQPQPGQAGEQQPSGQATVEGGRLKFGDFDLSPEDVRGLMERASLEKSRAATRPRDASAYELALPSDFVLPQGQTFKFATDDPVLGPLLGQAKQVAHELGIDQSGFSRLLGLFAASQINEARMIAAAGAKELAKLGENATNRVDAVRSFLRGHLGDELAGALQRGMHTERQVVAYERLMHKFTNQGGGNWSGAGREVDKQTISDEAYAKMSYTEKKAYAEAASARDQGMRR